MERPQLRGLSAVAAVSAVVAVDSLQRKPEEYKRQSFFGEYDLWLYVAVYDEVLCPKCLDHARKQVFRGTELRSKFEYLKIIDDDMIEAKVHPNCRCQLYRIIDPERYLRWLEKLENMS
jgi:hypothetical protein